jgi:tripartite-type tricarboxylate transporter receptor subunit TctC
MVEGWANRKRAGEEHRKQSRQIVKGSRLLNLCKADGYTIGLVTTSSALKPVYGDTKFNYPVEMEPIARVSTIPQVLTVQADSPWKTIDDFIKYAKENPGKIKFGHSGLGNNTHIVGEMFAKEAGIKIEQVPFDGGSQVITALLGGHIQITFTTPADLQDHVKAGKLRILAVASEARSDDEILKDVPTFNEKGINVEASSWNGAAAPKGLPEDVKKALAEAFKKIINVKEQADKIGLTLGYLGPEDFGKKWVTEYERFKQVVTETGILGVIQSQKK